jgi:TetR/AcrR family transcriptional regulator, transcriptional repressor for nem operon
MIVLGVKTQMQTHDQQNVNGRSARDMALEKAMQLFWRQGADATSYADLVAETGLSRKALYGHWPDKDHLLQAALQHYRDQVLTQALAPLELGGRAGLLAFWGGLVAATDSPEWRGCLLLRTGTGPLGLIPAVADLYTAHCNRLRAGLAKAIAEGQGTGQISAALDPDQAALAGLGLTISANLLSALPPQHSLAQEMIRAAARASGV